MIRRIIESIEILFFPDTCVVCGKLLVGGEEHICLQCLYALPRTNFHTDRENRVEKRFFGKIDVVASSAFFYYNKGSDFRKLIHLLKYKDSKEIGRVLGKHAARELVKCGVFENIDCIVALPLHKNKERKRGYNQAEWIAMGLSEILGKPIEKKGIERRRANVTQTRKGVFDRWLNVKDIFAVTDSERLRGKHILIVDDVITTGATLESCALSLLEVEGVRISIFALAVA